MKTPLLAAFLPALLFALPTQAEDGGSKTGLFNTRYCEILTVSRNGMKATATVYNTIGFNDCPAAAWNGIDKKAATKQLGADGLDMNGPRYWLIDGSRARVFRRPARPSRSTASKWANVPPSTSRSSKLWRQEAL